MAAITCCNCNREFDVADDDPLWSITTAVGDDGVERIVSKHIEPPCPSCGTVTVALPPDRVPDGPALDTGIVVAERLTQWTHGVVEEVDLPYDPTLDAVGNLAAQASSDAPQGAGPMTDSVTP